MNMLYTLGSDPQDNTLSTLNLTGVMLQWKVITPDEMVWQRSGLLPWLEQEGLLIGVGTGVSEEAG